MSLKVVCGGPAAPLTGAAYDAVRDCMDRGHWVALALPTLPDVRRARMALAPHRAIGLSVRELDGLIAAQWALYGDGRRVVGSVERRALLSRAWQDRAGDADPGEGVLGVLSTLAQRSCERERGAPRPGRSADDHGLLAAIVAYESLLARARLIEPGEAARLVAALGVAPAEHVVVHRFTELGAAQEAVILAWAAKADVTLTLPYAPTIPATRMLGPLVGRFRAAGATITLLSDSHIESGELEAVASRLFLPASPVTAEGAISFVTAEGVEGETCAVVERVARAIAAGVPPDRIAIGFRDPDRHVGWLRRAFEAGGIEGDFDLSTPAERTPLGRALIALWAFVAGGHERSDLSAFLRSPCAGMSPDRLDRLDERWRAERVGEGAALLLALGDSPQRRLIERAERLSRVSLDRADVKNWQSVLDELLANAHRGDPFCDPARLDAGVHRAFMDAMDSLSGVAGSCPGQAINALRRTRIPPAASERSGRVQVMDLGRLQTRRFDVVVLGGMNASEFPRPGAGDVLEGDVIGRVMDRLGIVHDQTADHERERLLFALVASRARSQLILVRQASDDEGRELRPSIFWDELLDIYRDPAGGDGTDGPVIEQREARDIATPRTSRVGAGRTRGALLDPSVLDVMTGSFESVSASDIEAYVGCPYAWFVERVLGPRGPDTLIDARTRGAVAHDALARFYAELHEATGAHRVTPATLPRALALAEKAAEAAIADVPDARTLEERHLLGSVRKAVRGLVERDAAFLPSFVPARSEWSFGVDGQGPQMGGFRLKGRVDRIDVGPEGVAIVDYKTGPATPVAAFEREGKLQLQLYALAARDEFDLPIAGGLYRSLTHQTDRGFVLSEVDDPGLRVNDRVDGPALDALLERAAEIANAAVQGMRAGDIAPAPDRRRCRYCAAAGYCPEAIR